MGMGVQGNTEGIIPSIPMAILGIASIKNFDFACIQQGLLATWWHQQTSLPMTALLGVATMGD